MKRSTVVELISALFILLFVYTAINKFLAFDDLKYVLKKYPLIGGFGEVIAWALPTVELITAILLFIPRWRQKGLYASLALMAGFTLYVIYLFIFAPNMPCTCGGMLQQLTWTQHLIFNIIFIILAVTGLTLNRKRMQTPKHTEEINEVVFT